MPTGTPIKGIRLQCYMYMSKTKHQDKCTIIKKIKNNMLMMFM